MLIAGIIFCAPGLAIQKVACELAHDASLPSFSAIKRDMKVLFMPVQL